MKQYLPRGGLAILVGLSSGLLLTGCLLNEEPIRPPIQDPKGVPKDSVPPGVPDTGRRIRDFAPIAEGNAWTYRHVHDNTGIKYPEGVWGEWSDTTWYTFRIVGLTRSGDSTVFSYRKVGTRGGLTDSLEIAGTAKGDSVAMGTGIQSFYDGIYLPWHSAHSISATLAAPVVWDGRPHFSATVPRNAPDNLGTAVVVDGIGMVSAVFNSHRGQVIAGFTRTTVSLVSFTPGE